MVYRISAIVHLYCDTAVTITSLMIVVYTYNLVLLLFVFIGELKLLQMIIERTTRHPRNFQ